MVKEVSPDDILKRLLKKSLPLQCLPVLQFQFKEFTFDLLGNMNAFIVSASIFAWAGETKRYKSFAMVSKDDLYKDFKRLKR